MNLNRDKYWKDRELGPDVPDDDTETPSGEKPTTRQLSPSRIMKIFGLVFGGILIFLTPPTQVPNEGAHFYRAYQISDFDLLPQRQGDEVGGSLPQSLSTVVNRLAQDLPFKPENKASLKKIWDNLFVPLEDGKKVFTAFPTSALNSPAAYLPQILAVFFGRTANLPPLITLYLARILNLLACVFLMVYAIQMMPICRWSLLFLALMPMTLFEMASATPEGLTFAAAFAFIAAVTRVSIRGFGGWDLGALIVFGFFTALTRGIYFPLLFFVLIIPIERFGGKRWYFSSIAIFAVVLLVPWSLWTWLVHGFFTPDRTDILIRPWIQGQVMFTDPLRFIHVIWTTLTEQTGSYIESFVGRLGYQDAPVPHWLVWIYIPAMLLLPFFEAALPVSWKWYQRAGTAVIFLSCTFAMLVVAYLTRTAVGYYQIDGFQGRDVIPLAPLLFVIFFRNTKRYRRFHKYAQWAATGVIFVSLLTTLFVVAHRYYF